MRIRRDEVMIVKGKLRQVGLSFRMSKHHHRGAVFECECGSRTVIRIGAPSVACGKCKSDTFTKAVTRHRMAKTKEYKIWSSMKARCQNESDKAYPMYGGRGISVCERWQSFENFFEDMGPKPPSLSVDRIDNNGDYCTENCHWVSQKKQMRNTRMNRYVEWNGEVHCISEWAEITGMSRIAIQHRLDRGWSVEDALTRPVKKKKPKE